MTRVAFRVLTVTAALLVGACSAHNPFIVSNKTTSSPVSESKFSPHSDKVFFTQESLPPAVTFELISTIDVGKVWYGSSKSVYKSMAERARQIGANAVVQVKTWHQPSGYSWSAPHGTGQAIHISDIDQLETLKIVGSWH
jgi:hypothetical protein